MNSKQYHLIIDFEATCSDDDSLSRQEMEIIEIGAVMFAEPKLNMVSEFQTFVKPVRNSQLTDFCKTLTHIRQEDVDNAPGFAEAIEKMKQWLSAFENFDFCSWGNYDKKQLMQDCQFHNIPLLFEAEHRNLKWELSKFLGVEKEYGLGKAPRKIGLQFEGTHHRGIDDAQNIARIYQYMGENKK